MSVFDWLKDLLGGADEHVQNLSDTVQNLGDNEVVQNVQDKASELGGQAQGVADNLKDKLGQ